jgi:hypothetical protein
MKKRGRRRPQTHRCQCLSVVPIVWLQVTSFDKRIDLPRVYKAFWPAPGFEDTELGVFMGPEVSHGATKVYAGVQA